MDMQTATPSQVRANAGQDPTTVTAPRAGDDARARNPLQMLGLDAPKAAAVIVIGAVLLLVALRAGFAGALGD